MNRVARRSPPPKGISQEAAGIWARLSAEHDLVDEAGKVILRTGLESFDRMRACQTQIARDGATTADRFGQVKAHPLLAVERDSRAAFLAALKQLNFDLEPLHDRPGRPGGH